MSNNDFIITHYVPTQLGDDYGPTQMHQARFISPRHQRDYRAGTTILQLVSAFYDRTQALISGYGPAGAAGAWATLQHPPGPQDRSRDYRLEEAAGSLRRAVGIAGPFQGLLAIRERTPPSTPPGPQYLLRNYGPDGSAGGLCLSTARQAAKDDSTTRPFWSGPTRQSHAKIHRRCR